MSSIRSTFMIKREQCLCIFICGCLYFQTIADVFITLIRMIIPVTYKIDTLIIYSIFGLCFLWGVPVIIRNISLTHIQFCLFVLICVLVSWVLYGDGEGIYFIVLKNICIGCIPAFLVVSSINNYTIFKNYLYGFSVLALVFEGGKIVLGMGLQTSETALYSQQTGYTALNISVICIMTWMDKRSWKSAIASVTGIGLLLISGARGPLLALGLYIFCQLVKEVYRRGKEKKVFVTTTVGTVVVLFILLNIRKIALLLQPFFLELNLSPRILYRIADGNMFEDSSRIQLIYYGIKSIVENPVLGVGVLQDRFMIRNAMEPYGQAIGWYPHNIVLEILMQFGIVMGLFLLFRLVLMIGRNLKYAQGDERKNLVLAFCGIGLFPLFISSSYIEWIEFYVLLGLCSAIGERGHDEVS